MSAPATTDAAAVAAPAPAAAAPAAVPVAAVPAAAAGAGAAAPAAVAVGEDVKAAIASNRKSLERSFKAPNANAGGPRASQDRGIAPGLHAMAKRLERNLLSNSLNQQLYGRDDHASLTRAGVIKAADVAPRLREKAARLQHARTRDQLGHLLEARNEQAHRRMRTEHAGVASRLQGVKRQLQHHMTTNKVGHLLEQRSELESLQRLGVSSGDARVAPLLIGPQRMLQRSLVKSHLFHLLNKRPKPEVAAQKRWFQAPEEADAADGEGEAEDDNGDGDEGEGDDGGSGGHLFDNHADADPNGAGVVSHGHGHAHAHPAADRKDQKHGGGVAHGSAGAHAAYGGADHKTADGGYQRRSKNFHLTRILLKTVAAMAESGELTLPQKGLLKDRIVDQDHVILQVAETYDAENDLAEFKESLIQLADISAKRS